jgi:ribonuclease J
MNRPSTSTNDYPKGLDKGLWFVPLGGAGEIGMNLNLYGCDGQWMMVDCGVTFGDDSIPGVDVVMPDPAFIVERREKLVGLVLTHAHEDHLGAVAYLWPELRCPVYATPFAAAFLQYKLKEAGIEDEVPVTIVPLGGRIEVGPFTVDFLTLTHSIPEPNALVIRSKYGNLFHTGDWKFDPEPVVGEAVDYKKLEAVGREDILALIGDSTNVLTEGEAGSERDVRDNLVKLFARFTGRIIVGCFASNVARLDSIAHAAMANDRHVSLVGASLWRIAETARRTGYLASDLRFLEASDAAHLPRDKVLYICTGSQGEGRAALSRIAANNHPDLTIEEGDVAVFSSRVIPGNEKAIHRLQNLLVSQGAELITTRDSLIHVSGHPARDELKRMYGFIRPRIAIPVHGEAVHMRAHAALAAECQVPESVLVENGGAIRFRDGTAKVEGHVWSGRMTWEDGEVISFSDPVLRDRKRMFYEGSAAATVVFGDDGELLADPQVTVLGSLDPMDEDRTWADTLRGVLSRLPKRARLDDDVIEDTVRSAVRRAMSPRKPVVKVHIVRV